MAQWILTDNSSGSPVNLVFNINPISFSHPGREAQLTTEYSTAPTGTTIVFQGKDKIQTGSFEGAIITQAFYNEINTWARKPYALVLTDDQGNTWDILITNLKLTRVKRRNPWRFDYAIQFLEVT